MDKKKILTPHDIKSRHYDKSDQRLCWMFETLCLVFSFRCFIFTPLTSSASRKICFLAFNSTIQLMSCWLARAQWISLIKANCKFICYIINSRVYLDGCHSIGAFLSKHLVNWLTSTNEHSSILCSISYPVAQSSNVHIRAMPRARDSFQIVNRTLLIVDDGKLPRVICATISSFTAFSSIHWWKLEFLFLMRRVQNEKKKLPLTGRDCLSGK